VSLLPKRTPIERALVALASLAERLLDTTLERVAGRLRRSLR